MAQPVQYIPQFVPTNFNALQDVLGMYRGDLAQRDEMFDRSSAMSNQMISELYNQETLDPDVLGSEVGRFSSKLDELVSKYSGDYGAAAKDIARLGVREMANPIYKLNKQKVEQAKMLQQMLDRNPNLLALRDPRKVKLSRDLSIDDLGYEVADPASIQEAIKDIYGSYGTRIRQSGLSQERPGILKSTITKGLTDEEISQMQQDENVRNTILARNPQLQKYLDNPEVSSWFNTQLSQGLSGLKGGTQLDFMNDPNFVKPINSGIRSSRLDKDGSPQLNIFQDQEVKYNTDKIKENLSFLRKGVKSGKFDSTSIPKQEKMFDPFVEGVVYDFMNEMQYLGEGAFNLGLNVLNMEDKEKEHSKYWEQSASGSRQKRMINKYELLVDSYKTKYSNLYKSSKNDEEFLNKVEEMEIANSAVKGSELSIADPNISKNVFVSVKEIKDGKKGSSTFISKTNGDGISRKEAEERLGASPLQVRINSEGIMTVAIPNEKGSRYEDYIMNPDALPAQLATPTDNKSLREINDIFTRYDLSDTEINDINNNVYQFQGSPYFYQVYVDPKNPKNKTLSKIIGKDLNGEFVYDNASLSELQYINAINKFQSIKGE